MEKDVIAMLDEVLSLQGRGLTFTAETKLLGALPELDSLHVANLLARIESQFKFQIYDDEIDGSIFKTVGSLTEFIEGKMKS